MPHPSIQEDITNTPGRLIEAESDATRPERLVVLAGDANLQVRRAAAVHPSLPPDTLRALRGLGANADLSVDMPIDSNLSPDTLRTLSSGGEWARERVAKHPNAPAGLLDGLSNDRADAVRLEVARHPRTEAGTLEPLLTDENPRIRAAAAAHPTAPKELLDLLIRAGSTAGLSGVTEPTHDLDASELQRLIGGGPWARRVAASHPQTSLDDLVLLAQDQTWWVRAAVAQHPKAPTEALEYLQYLDVPEVQAALASHPKAAPAILARLSGEDHATIRAAVAGNPNTPPEALARLLGDGAMPIRVAAAANPATPPDTVTTMRRAGSSEDLSTFAPPDETLDAATLNAMSRGGDWARQLAARHSNTPPDALTRLAVDGHFFVRETVARRDDLPAAIRDLLTRAGSSDDFQDFIAPESMTDDELSRISGLGPWGRRLSARHPSAETDLLTRLANDSDWQVRRTIARHPGTGRDTLIGLAQDAAADVRWSVLKHPAPPAEALALLASDEHAPIRLAIAADERTPRGIVERLKMDLDEDVRAAARERLGA